MVSRINEILATPSGTRVHLSLYTTRPLVGKRTHLSPSPSSQIYFCWHQRQLEDLTEILLLSHPQYVPKIVTDQIN